MGLAPQRYTDSFQGWRVQPLAGYPGEFQIVLDADRSRVLATDSAGNIVLSSANPDDPLQRWQFEIGDGQRFDSYCVALKARQPGNCYLTATPDLKTLKLASRTSTTSGQEWIIDPRTPVLLHNVPQWEYHTRINDLARFLAIRQKKAFVRIFAGEVVISSPFSWMTTTDQLRADIRVDCHRLVLSGTPLVALNGSFSEAQWSQADQNPLNYVSFNPDPAQPAKSGLRGFSAGRLIINALEMDHQNLQKLTVQVMGGTGGCGQAGYPGRNGDRERNWNGEDGGNGGDGGRGGDGGTVILRCDSVVPATPIPYQGLADGGHGGVGGAAGPGGTASKVGVPGTGIPVGHDGLNGRPGQQGASGRTGLVQIDTSGGTLAAMQTDTFPGSLRLRIHQAIDDEMYQLAQTGDLNAFAQNTAWLGDIARRFVFAEVSIRLKNAAAYAKQASLANPDWYKDMQAQELTMRADALREDMRQFDALLPPRDKGTPSIAIPAPPTNLTGTVVGTGSALQSVIRPMSRIPGAGEGPVRGDLSGYHPLIIPMLPPTPTRNYCAVVTMVRIPDMSLTQIMETVPAGTAQVNVGNIYGKPSFLTRAEADYWKNVTIADIRQLYNTTSPDGDAGEILAMCPPCVVGGALELMLALEAAAATEAPSGSCAWWTTCKAPAKCIDRYTDPVYIAETEAAEAELKENNTSRDEKDAVNDEVLTRERDVETVRDSNEKTRKDDDEIPKIYGASVVAILDSLAPLDTNSEGDKSNRYIAVFDGFFDWGITNPMLNVATTLGASQVLSVIVTVTVDQKTADSLVPGGWHRIGLNYATVLSGQGSIEGFIYAPELSSFGAKSEIKWRVLTIGAYPFEASYISRLDLFTAVILNKTCMYDDVQINPSKKTGPQNIAMISREPARAEFTQDAGMGEFNTFDLEDMSDSFAFDVGYGKPIGYSSTIEELMTTLAANEATIVVSHWDTDHYRALTRADNCAQLKCKIVGPAYGLKGQTLINLVRAIAGNGPGHLFIVGDVTTAYMQFDPGLVQNAVRCRDIQGLLDRRDEVPVPANVTLAISDHRPVRNQFNKNNTLSICAAFTLAARGIKLLMPGDCSYCYIPDELKENITHLQAVHHGSLQSLRTPNGGRLDRTAPDNTDIPVPEDGSPAIVYFSYGDGNRYRISVARVWDYYTRKGWRNYERTMDLPPGGYYELPPIVVS